MCMRSVQSRICTISRFHCAFSESRHCMPILRLHDTSAQSQDCAISVACTIEPRLSFEFPSFIKVRNILKELLQLRCHHQCQACTQAPVPGISGKFADLEKLPSPQSGYGHRETPDLWSAQGFKASPTWRALNSQTLSPHYACELRSCNLEIGTQFPDSESM